MFCFSCITKKSHPQCVWSRDVSIKHISQKSHLSVSGLDVSSSNIFQVAGFASNPFANLHLSLPKKRSPPVCLIIDKYVSLLCTALLHWQRTMSLSFVLLSYIDSKQCLLFMSLLSHIDSRQCLYFLSCSPTMIADNAFISCLALLHWQQTISLFLVMLSYIDSRLYIFLWCPCSLTLTADNAIPFISCLVLPHWWQTMSFIHVLALLHWQRTMSLSFVSFLLH